ncbi:MAG: polyprenyl synthetase family protein [Deltaproteobacteria bacterium]|jgi:octaprenyl-diphosphate synthase|nr:polyprenyl synthetase family protein [Deltaproteobacteria bacterium]
MSDAFLASLTKLTGQINQALEAVLNESSDLPARMGFYGLAGGGKRLRPIMFCLAAKALGREIDEPTLRLSTIFELLHLSTLFHDDIIDMSATRRGQPAAHLAFGVPEAVLAADYLLAKSAEVALATNNMDCFKVFIHVIKELSLGELEQLKSQNQALLSRQDYDQIIYRKTAVLMEGVGQIAGLWLGVNPEKTQALGEFGARLGLAFQIIDDVLDYEGQPKKLGKPIGQDLDEGRITLPFILARQELTGEARDLLIELGQKERRTPEEKAQIVSLVKKAGGVRAARLAAQEMADLASQALNCLAPNEARANLEKLAQSAVARKS